MNRFYFKLIFSPFGKAIAEFSKPAAVPRWIVFQHKLLQLINHSVLIRQPVHKNLAEPSVGFQNSADFGSRFFFVKILKALHRGYNVKAIILKARVLSRAYAEINILHSPVRRVFPSVSDLVFRDIRRRKLCARVVHIYRQNRRSAA